MATSQPANLHALAAEVAQLLARPESDGLLTARQVASRFNVDRNWVYAHANELGVIRLGNGPRPRLRFDSAVVARCLLPSPLAAGPTAVARGTATHVPLLPIKSTRMRRTLDS
jgi:hypothetical protein